MHGELRPAGRAAGDVHHVVVADVHDVVVVACVGLAATQDRLHPSDDLARAEGLGHVVIGAQLQAEDPIDLAVPGSEEQHGHAAARPDPAAHLEAVDVGQTDVEHDHRRPLLLDEFQSAPAMVRLQDAEPGVAQVHVEQVGDVGVVLDDDDGAFCFGHRLMLPRCYGAERHHVVYPRLGGTG